MYLEGQGVVLETDFSENGLDDREISPVRVKSKVADVRWCRASRGGLLGRRLVRRASPRLLVTVQLRGVLAVPKAFSGFQRGCGRRIKSAGLFWTHDGADNGRNRTLDPSHPFGGTTNLGS